jgi:hypothetical protein
VGELSDFEQGIILGILVGEGHFGGDGRQAQVTLKMHVRHESLVRWLHERIDGSKIYGPYHYDGRHFLQLMIRGEGLKRVLVPMLSRLPWKDLDAHSYDRFRGMCERYRLADGVVSPGSSP